MKEGLLPRIGRLVSASANSLVDSLENAAPHMVMEEAIRELDQAVVDVRAQLGKVEASRYLSSKSLNSDNAKHTELQEQIEIAINQGRDDLAQVAIAKQMDIEAKLPVVEKSIVDNDAEINELNSYIQALLAKKREMQQALTDYRKVAGHHVDSQSDARAASQEVANSVDKATGAFDRVLNKVGVPGVGQEADAKLAELEQLARDNRIQERLAKIKSQVDK